jgi:hypothetical protein
MVAEIRKSDTKIRSSAVEPSHQQTPVPSGGVRLPTNFSAQRWRIPINVHARMKRLNFPKFKVAFTVKLKMISIDHYFRLNQTPKNTENIFQKTFYAETNGA